MRRWRRSGPSPALVRTASSSSTAATWNTTPTASRIIRCCSSKTEAARRAAGQRRDDTLVSHGGLTFGGFVSDERMRTPTMLRAVRRAEAASAGPRGSPASSTSRCRTSITACRPRKTCTPSSSTTAGWCGATCRPPSAWRDRPASEQGPKWGRSGPKRTAWRCGPASDFDGFMAIEEENLRKKYGVSPTHSAAEMRAAGRAASRRTSSSTGPTRATRCSAA